MELFEVYCICGLSFELLKKPIRGPREFEAYLELGLQVEADSSFQAEGKAREAVQEAFQFEGLDVLLGSDDCLSAHVYPAAEDTSMLDLYVGLEPYKGIRDFEGEIRLDRIEITGAGR